MQVYDVDDDFMPVKKTVSTLGLEDRESAQPGREITNTTVEP